MRGHDRVQHEELHRERVSISSDLVADSRDWYPARAEGGLHGANCRASAEVAGATAAGRDSHTLTLRNEGDDVRVEGARPVPADATVRASLLGFTDCASGCIGSARARPWVVAQAKRSVTTAPPFTLESSERSRTPLREVLRVRAASDNLLDPCLYVSAVELALPTGETARARFVTDD